MGEIAGSLSLPEEGIRNGKDSIQSISSRPTSPPAFPSIYPKPGTSSSKVHGTFWASVRMASIS